MRSDTPNNLVNDIYVSLKQDILWLRLKPKTMLTETYLAEIYKTSKTPIREALSMLVRDELVSVFPRKGYMVTDVSMSDMRDMHQYRYILENANLVHAVKYATKEQLAHLDELAEMDRYYTEDDPHFSKEVVCNNAFHFYLAEMTGNRILLKQLTDTLEKLQRIMYFVAEKNYMFRGCEEHHQLVRHIADKELEKAQIILHHHISEVLEHISKMRGISKLF
ncbi:GntR family transcriptional regulator [Cloacibacillus sp.]|uniref:GntR family transcriptional regulator n=1 Tax=Cloacibacillus sp. TaxID=2049023 RepID=UPI0025B8EFD1|nr:GntR family transcriptional regulator [Cloacibacillus sp.]MCC8057645.1 GntR family transcriptional regulator [Cloacibacillus sp.]MCC8177671.1 GntR family transcriptional regulator [Cloacibacillus sp.]